MNPTEAYYISPSGKRYFCWLIATYSELGGVARIKRGEHEELVALSSVKPKAEVDKESFAKRKAAAEEFCKENAHETGCWRRQVRYRMKKYGIKDPRL